jgi:hypothetical protein
MRVEHVELIRNKARELRRQAHLRPRIEWFPGVGKPESGGFQMAGTTGLETAASAVTA